MGTAIAEEMTRLVSDMYAGFQTGDTSAWSGRMARHHEVIGIGSDPEEFWVGPAKLAEVTDAQLRDMSTAGIKLTPSRIRAHGAGDVGWAVDEPVMAMPDGSSIRLRLSVVAVKEDGELRWTHFHLSAGVPNEELLELELPT